MFLLLLEMQKSVGPQEGKPDSILRYPSVPLAQFQYRLAVILQQLGEAGWIVCEAGQGGVLGSSPGACK